jgi:hypothetical protein
MRHHSTADLGMARTRVMGGFQLKEFSQPPHRRLPWHEHRDASICFVVAGSYAERMRGQDRECAPHAMIFKPPGERHADQFGREGGTCLLIEIGPERLETLKPVSDVTARPGVARSARLAGLGHRFYREFAAGDDLAPLAVEALVLELLVEAARGGRSERSRSPPGSEPGFEVPPVGVGARELQRHQVEHGDVGDIVCHQGVDVLGAQRTGQGLDAGTDFGVIGHVLGLAQAKGFKGKTAL